VTDRRSLKTAAERLFAAYLADRHTWIYERAIQQTKPDFFVGQTVVCDVTAIEADHLPVRFGNRDPVHPIRNKIYDKWPQADAARSAGYPFVLVLHQEGLRTDLNVTILAAACFGDLSLSMAFDPDAGELHSDDGLVFGVRGKTEPDGNTGLSAIAVLQTFNPTLVEFQLEFAKLRSAELGGTTDPHEAIARSLEIGAEAEARLAGQGRFEPMHRCLA
jgi:hypothetical protein